MTDYEKKHEKALYESREIDDQRDAVIALIMESGLIKDDGNAGLIVMRLMRMAKFEGKKQATREFKEKLEKLKNKL